MFRQPFPIWGPFWTQVTMTFNKHWKLLSLQIFFILNTSLLHNIPYLNICEYLYIKRKIIYFLQIPHRAKEHFGSHFQSEVHFELKWQWLSISIENWQLGWKVANEDVASSISFEPHQIANVGDRPVVVFPAYKRYEYRVIQKFKLIHLVPA